MRVTYVGHATVLIELAGTRLLTDPVLRTAVFGGIIRRAGDPPVRIDPLPDAVLISHQHQDHLDLPSLRSLGARTSVFAPRGSGKRIRRAGMRGVTELSPGDAATAGEVEIIATRAEHDGRRLPVGRPVEALGYQVRGAGQSVYFAGDTDVFDEMSELEGVDVALLPIGGWGPSVGKGHLDPQRAAEVAALIRPRVVVPIHWGTVLRAGLARSRPGLLTDAATEFRSRMAELAPQTEARILKPGESFTFDP